MRSAEASGQGNVPISDQLCIRKSLLETLKNVLLDILHIGQVEEPTQECANKDRLNLLTIVAGRLPADIEHHAQDDVGPGLALPDQPHEDHVANINLPVARRCSAVGFVCLFHLHSALARLVSRATPWRVRTAQTKTNKNEQPLTPTYYLCNEAREQPVECTAA